jgi:FG-GAP repeat
MNRIRIAIALCLLAQVCSASDRSWTEVVELHSRFKFQKSLGDSISISGSTLVAGADDEGPGTSGDLCVFLKPKAGWQAGSVCRILHSSDSTTTSLGRSVSVSGNTVAGGCYEGPVYVFVKPATGWKTMTQTARLTPSDQHQGIDGAFGASVLVVGNTIMVGDPGPYTNKVYIYVKPAGGWRDMTETAQLVPTDHSLYAGFGVSMAVQGNTAVIGAFDTSVGNGQYQGAAYVFKNPGTGWTHAVEVAELSASNGENGDIFGRSVAMNGSTAVVGAYRSEGGAGSAYVFVEPSGGWTNMTETAQLTASDGGGALGFSVSISGSTIVSGAITTPHLTNAGAVYVFVEPSGGWTNMTETTRLTASDTRGGDNFGVSTILNTDGLFVGAEGHEVDNIIYSGAVYLFANQ